jgi:hypothetical protein
MNIREAKKHNDMGENWRLDCCCIFYNAASLVILEEIEWNGNRQVWDTAPHQGVSKPILTLFQ